MSVGMVQNAASSALPTLSGHTYHGLCVQAAGRTFQSIVDSFDGRGRTPLHVAAAAGRADVVEQLLYVGCDVSKPLAQDLSSEDKV